jgi:hypothetical protein
MAVKQDMYCIKSSWHDPERYNDPRISTRIIRNAICHLNLRLHEEYGESELTCGEIHNLPFFPGMISQFSSFILQHFMMPDLTLTTGFRK